MRLSWNRQSQGDAGGGVYPGDGLDTHTPCQSPGLRQAQARPQLGRKGQGPAGLGPPLVFVLPSQCERHSWGGVGPGGATQRRQLAAPAAFFPAALQPRPQASCTYIACLKALLGTSFLSILLHFPDIFSAGASPQTLWPRKRVLEGSEPSDGSRGVWTPLPLAKKPAFGTLSLLFQLWAGCVF